MARGEMLMVFCYDVSDDRRRRTISRKLEPTMTRVQYSVFEGRMTRARAESLARSVNALLQKGDSLRVYAIGSNGERRSVVHGDGPPIEPAENYWLL